MTLAATMTKRKNPGALAGATGAIGKAGELRPIEYPARRPRASETAPTGAEVLAAADRLRARLSPCAIYAGATTYLAALDAAQLADLAARLTPPCACGAEGRAGVPGAPFWSVDDDARDWAATASRGELRAYAAAIAARLERRAAA